MPGHHRNRRSPGSRRSTGRRARTIRTTFCGCLSAKTATESRSFGSFGRGRGAEQSVSHVVGVARIWPAHRRWGVERRQVFDLPALAVRVSEHRPITRRCSCGSIIGDQAPKQVKAPVVIGAADHRNHPLSVCGGSSCPRRAPHKRWPNCSAPRSPRTAWRRNSPIVTRPRACTSWTRRSRLRCADK